MHLGLLGPRLCCTGLLAIIAGIDSGLAIGLLSGAFAVVSDSSTRPGSFGRFDPGRGRKRARGTCWSQWGSWQGGCCSCIGGRGSPVGLLEVLWEDVCPDGGGLERVVTLLSA